MDRILEQDESRIITLKNVSAAEEYLRDHFPSFPVLPGVLMLECMVQAARRLAEPRSPGPLVLSRVRALKFGRFVKPGDSLRVEVLLLKPGPDGSFEFSGTAGVPDPGAGPIQVAAAGKFTLRPVRLPPEVGAS